MPIAHESGRIGVAPQLHGELRRLSSARIDGRRVVGVVLPSLLTIGAVIALLVRNVPATVGLFIVDGFLWLRAWVGFHLSVVEIDGAWLLASSPSRRAWIPLAAVTSVSRVWFPGAQRIYLEVERDGRFDQIVFEAPFEPRAIFGKHPVIEELRMLIARAKAAGRS
jgi:hypothetical protein